MPEVQFDEDEGTVTLDDVEIGTIWQMHASVPRGRFRKTISRVRTGTFRAWAAETPEGVRNWFRSQEEAIEWLVEEAR